MREITIKVTIDDDEPTGPGCCDGEPCKYTGNDGIGGLPQEFLTSTCMSAMYPDYLKGEPVNNGSAGWKKGDWGGASFPPPGTTVISADEKAAELEKQDCSNAELKEDKAADVELWYDDIPTAEEVAEEDKAVKEASTAISAVVGGVIGFLIGATVLCLGVVVSRLYL
jgi:hypothetical protein